MPGVGGRRWAKYAKYLKRFGWDVKVLTQKPSSVSIQSLWLEDISHLDQPYYYSTWYPKVLTKTKLDSFFHKISYSFWSKLLPFLTVSNYYDRAAFAKKCFLRKLDFVVKKESISQLIVSGAPFNLLYYSALYCDKKKDISFYADLRDPWTWGQNYGINSIHKSRKEKEKIKEEFVIKTAVKVFVPTDSMLDYLSSNYPSYKPKFFLLPHGFDKEALIKKEQHSVNEKIKIAFIGELYNGIENFIQSFTKGIVHGPFSLDIYSLNTRYQNVFEEHNIYPTKVKYNKLLPPLDLFKKLENIDYVLIIHPEFAKDYISTKFHELVYAQIPIIYIGEQGKTSDFIEEYGLGLYLGSTPNEIENNLRNYEQFKSFQYKPTFEINSYNLEKLTEQLINHLHATP